MVAQVGNQVAIPAHNNVYNGFSRGYSFVANNDFFIQDFELPLDAQQAGDIAGVVVRINGVQVFYATGGTNAIMTPPAPISVMTGDIVDVVGNWSPVATTNFTAHNSYSPTGAPFATTIEGVATNLDRTGVQYDINDPAYTTAAYLAPTTGQIGRVWTYTTPPAGIFASFSAAPASGASPLTVAFTDTTFTDDPGGVISWDWDLDGDGLTDSTAQNPTFTYASCGSYDVTLTATDVINGSSTTTVVGAVTVDEVVADFSVAELVPGSGLWQFTDLSSPTPTAWDWDFDGDGTVDDTNQNPVYFDPSMSPILSLPNCTLTVQGAGGCFSDTLVRAVNATGYGVANGPMAGGNGTLATPAVGTYFDISVGVAEGISITGMETGVYGYAGTADVRVYITPGTHVGNEGNAAAWTLAGEGVVTFTGTGAVATPEFASVALNNPFYLPAGDYGVACYHIDQAGGSVQVSYTNGPANSPYGNADLTIHPAGVGCSSTSELGPCAFSPRLWNGRFLYETCSVSSNAAGGTYAIGCANSAGVVPSLAMASLPQLGGNYEVDLDAGLGVAAASIIVLGESKDLFNALPLPFDLGVIGAPGCNLAVSADATSLLIANAGPGNLYSLPIPNDPLLICAKFYAQAAVLDIPANTLGFVLSNAQAAVIGN
ncbi:MAG: PKD domain-containing protein [Planctomycetota bacterium]